MSRVFLWLVATVVATAAFGEDSYLLDCPRRTLLKTPYRDSHITSRDYHVGHHCDWTLGRELSGEFPATSNPTVFQQRATEVAVRPEGGE